MLNNIQLLQLQLCLEHIDAIDNYFSNIQSEDDLFTKGDGVYYDAILMRLQTLCESLKKLNTNHPDVIINLGYSQINDLIKFRDLVSHHYEKLKHEIIYDICSKELPHLRTCIVNLLDS